MTREPDIVGEESTIALFERIIVGFTAG